jgi:hypothetical protein
MTNPITLLPQAGAFGKRAMQAKLGDLFPMVSSAVLWVLWQWPKAIPLSSMPEVVKKPCVVMFPLAMGYGRVPMQAKLGHEQVWIKAALFRA